jgi:hypothetical protein
MTCGCDGALPWCDGGAIAASVDDAAAFEAVFEHHFDVVWRYACRRAGPHAADDVASRSRVHPARARIRELLDAEGATTGEGELVAARAG